MNHDYAHCADYRDDCPEECFRAQLTRDLKGHAYIATFASFYGTEECLRNDETKD